MKTYCYRCERCGIAFEGRKRRFCTYDCASKVRYEKLRIVRKEKLYDRDLKCAECGGIFHSMRKRTFCSLTCERVVSNRKLRAQYDAKMPLEKSCTDCGRSIFTKRSIKILCMECVRERARVSPKRQAYIARIKHDSELRRSQVCEICAKPFIRHKPGGNKSTTLGRFCSRKCSGFAHRKPKKVRSASIVTRRCIVCDALFSISNRRGGVRKMCSDDCRAKRTERQYYKTNRSKQVRRARMITCVGCGKVCLTIESHRKKFCDAKCGKRYENDKMKRAFLGHALYARSKGVKLPKDIVDLQREHARTKNLITELKKGSTP